VRGVLEANLHGVLKVLPAGGRPRLAFTPLAEEVLEEVSEAAAFAEPEIAHIEIREVRPVKPAAATCSRLEGTMAELIVFLPEFGVAEDVIGLRDLLETALILFIPRVQVGMMFSCQSAVSLLDLLIRGRALDPQNFVIIALCC
jgi:hypothetical protein